VLNTVKNIYRKAFVSDHPFMLTLGNLREPRKIVEKIQYDQLFGKLPLVSRTHVTEETKEPIDKEFVNSCTQQLKQRGIAILPGYFASEAKKIWDKYVVDKENWPAENKYTRSFYGIFENALFSEIILDETLLNICSSYYGCQPYVRSGPSVTILHPENSTVSEEYFHPMGLHAWNWHIDTTNLLSFHVILNDTNETDTRMLYADGSHKVHRSASGMRTEDNIRNKYNVTNCCGPQGTLYIFDNNGLHRPNAVADSLRSTFEFYFTPGNDIQGLSQMRDLYKKGSLHGRLYHQHYTESAIEKIIIPDSLSPIQREALEKVKR
jgi:hypothetical protein